MSRHILEENAVTVKLPRLSTIVLGLAAWAAGIALGGALVAFLLFHQTGAQTLGRLLGREGDRPSTRAKKPSPAALLATSRFSNWQPVASVKSPGWLVRRGLDVELVAEGLDRPVGLAARHGGDESSESYALYIAERSGAIRRWDANGSLCEYVNNLNLSSGDTKIYITGLTSILDSDDVVVTATRAEAEGDQQARVIRLESAVEGKAWARGRLLATFGAGESNDRPARPPVCDAQGNVFIPVDAGDGPHSQLIVQIKATASAPDNETPGSAVFAAGLHKVTGLARQSEGGGLYALDSGATIARLVKLDAGEQYGWDGRADSMRVNAMYIWGPNDPIRPAGLAFLSRPALGEGSSGHGIVAAAGANHGADQMPAALLEFALVPATRLLSRVPEPLVERVASRPLHITAVAEGADGVYFTTDESGADDAVGAPGGKLWRVVVSKETLNLPDANAEALAKLTPEQRGELFFSQNCASCHRMSGVGGGEGPELTHAFNVLSARLNSSAYRSLVEGMLKSKDPYLITQRERHLRVLAAPSKERVRVWLQNHLEEPRFDHPFAKMPSFALGLTREKRNDIIAYLLSRK